MICRRCENSFSGNERWALVTRHGAPLEPCGHFYICEECHEGLLAWVGIRPDTPDLWHAEKVDLEADPRPFSCGDERLGLTR